MVSFYKHDIPPWMDDTESLSDGEYRLYHVCRQVFMLNEGPVTLNERGLAGRCCQRPDRFRVHFQGLLNKGKMRLVDGKITNDEWAAEIARINQNRANAAKGGRESGNSRRQKTDGHEGDNDSSPTAYRTVDDTSPHGLSSSPTDYQPVSPAKPLKENDPSEAPLQWDGSLKDKTRLDKTRESDAPAAPRARRQASRSRRTPLPEDWKPGDGDRQRGHDLGLDDGQIDYVADEFAEYWRSDGGGKANWSLTFRNQLAAQVARWGAQKVPRAVAPSPAKFTFKIVAGTPQWEAWRNYFRTVGKSSMIMAMESCGEKRLPFPRSEEWPPGYDRGAADRAPQLAA
jgi:hypothetical protein